MPAAPEPDVVVPGAEGLPFVDSHCHLADGDFDHDRAAVGERATAAGVGTLLVVGGLDGQGGHLRTLEVAEGGGHPCAVGIHPHEARLASDAAYAELERVGRAGRIVAVGEIGLDYHYDFSPHVAQQEAFRRQIGIALALGRPIIVHTREADADTLEILEEENAGAVGGVIHCFTGDAELARRALGLGFYISFSGIVAFPRAEALREVARTVPADRLLIETDAPYLAPPPHRGKRNEPAFVREVARALALARTTSGEEIGRLSAANFRRCFRL